ncbi:uncharacterized protein LOC122006237 [Zingiber officinale]|uniref:Glutaredoxin-like protein n=1 Tax=Zingiber officinale TaxID=94328 RepID=A0A8J5FRD7_ZINOF|nr:uncharacterized protein LOC122006237 [Zingiber officinale]KAG6490191.1 hypothetical protein ZIOFF_051476 [Zingiber officinale]
MAALVAFAPSALLALRLASSSAPLKARSALQSRSLRAYSASSYSYGGGGGEDGRWQLVLYSKPGCCLCDGLKEKLDAALSLEGGPHSLLSVDLQVRDITENPEWERLYQYEIPVLAKVLPDGSEATLPRLSPRLSVELIQRKIAEAFKH